MSAKKIIFITGTDTGVGKTLLTGLLLHHLGKSGIHALAMKPFCSGGLADVRFLQSLQHGELRDEEMNPFYFSQPIAPLVAMKKNASITLKQVIERIARIEKKCDRLLIEGSGGLMVPLGKGFTVADVIAELQCNVVIAARNRLGTINHSLLTVNALRALGIPAKKISLVVLSTGKSDLSSKTNFKTIAQLIRPISAFEIPFIGPGANSAKVIQKKSAQVWPVLAQILEKSASSER